MNYEQKYLKYKQKYINIKKNLKQIGSGRIDNISPDLYEHIAIRMDVNEIGKRIKELILEGYPDEHITIFMENDSISKFNIELMREFFRPEFIRPDEEIDEEIDDYSIFLKDEIENIYTETLQSRVGDDYAEVIGQHSGATDKSIMFFELLYSSAQPGHTIKIINVLPDGKCFYHALYVYIKMARIPYDVNNNFDQLYDALYSRAVQHIYDRYRNPGDEMTIITKLDELNNPVPSTDFLIPVAADYLKLNIMIIQVDSSTSELFINVKEIDDPRGYVILFQSGAHYKLIYYTDNTDQVSIYTIIKETYRQNTPANFVSL